MRSRPTRLALTAVAALAVAGLGAPALTSPAAAGPGKASTAKPDKPDKPTEVRFATFNASLNRGTEGQLVDGPVRAGQRAGVRRRGDDPARRRGRHPGQRVRLRAGRRGGRAVPRQLPRGRPERGRTGRLPLLLRRAVQHRHPERLRPQQQRRGGAPGTQAGGDDSFGFGLLPGPVRHGRLLQVPHRDRRGPHLPALPLEGHAGRAAARRPGDPRAGRLVLPRGARRLPPLVEVALGRPDQAARTQAGPLPRLAPDAAHLRRRRGPQRASQPRRDPLLGRLRHRRERRVLHLRRRGRRPAASVAGRTS